MIVPPPFQIPFNILLGSRSPRRRELMSQLCIPFSVIDIKDVKEEYSSELAAARVPEFLSNLKFDAYRDSLEKYDLLITADTVVINNGMILGKPADAESAKAMMRQLADNTHEVITGVTMGTIKHRISFSATTKVIFGPLSSEEIDYYVDHFQPLDKAGAYGIQEWIGCVAVKRIEGSYYNVMGLPVYRLYHELRDFIVHDNDQIL